MKRVKVPLGRQKPGANAYTANRQGQYTKIGAESVLARVRRAKCDIGSGRNLE